MAERQIEDSEDFRFFMKNYRDILNQLDEDRENPLYQMPEEWDRDFRRTICDFFREKRKAGFVRQIRRKGLIAAAALAVFIGMSAGAAHGCSPVDVFVYFMEQGRNRNMTMWTTEESVEAPEEETQEIYFEETELGPLNEEIRGALGYEILYLEEVDFPCEVTSAYYNKFYQILNIEIRTENGMIYLSERKLDKEGGTGLVTDGEACAEVENAALGMQVPIYPGAQKDYYVFSIEKDNHYFSCNVYGSMEECAAVAERVVYG